VKEDGLALDILVENKDGWSRALSFKQCSANKETLALHLEKDLELNLALGEKLALGWGPMFWNVMIDELEEGAEGNE